MEHKIGEIFEYNGDWYQCLKSTDDSCMNCDMCFDGKCPIPLKECLESGRSDKSYVIFKKLEKIGKPFIGEVLRIQLQRYKIYTKPIINPAENVNYINEENTIAIEIKQNKEEDMEEKKTNFVEAIDALCKRYNMSDGVRTDFISEVKEIIKDNDKEYNLKPFDLEAAKSGKPVCTRDGIKARIICFDYKSSDDYSMIALIDIDNNEIPYKYTKEGKFNLNHIDAYDLMMLPEKKEGWVNIYDDMVIYESEEEAKIGIATARNYIATTKVEWEE